MCGNRTDRRPDWFGLRLASVFRRADARRSAKREWRAVGNGSAGIRRVGHGSRSQSRKWHYPDPGSSEDPAGSCVSQDRLTAALSGAVKQEDLPGRPEMGTGYAVELEHVTR